jgi:pectinesterase
MGSSVAVPDMGLPGTIEISAKELSRMSKVLLVKRMLTAAILVCFAVVRLASAHTLFPADAATMVNPDVQLKLTFKGEPHAGIAGKIAIHDAADGRLVDALDMSIPPGPTTRVDPAVRARNYLAFPYPYARRSRLTNANTAPDRECRRHW